MPRDNLGPWGRLYATMEEDLAHFDDRQFRAFVGILCRSIRGRGEIPRLKPLRAIYGAEVVDFLVEEGRLTVDGNAVTVTDATVYNAPPDVTNADRQRRFRERNQGGSNGDNGVTNGLPSSSTYSGSSITGERNDEQSYEEGRAKVPERWTDLSNLITELTGKPYALPNPWGKMSERAMELIERYGWEAFRDRAVLVAERIGKNPGVDEIIFGVGNSMRRNVETADVAKVEQADQVNDTARRTAERTQLQIHGYGQHDGEPAAHPVCPACRGEVVV